MKQEKKIWLFIKVVAFIVAVITMVDTLKEGYSFIEAVLISLLAFFGTIFSLVLGLSEKEKSGIREYEDERKKYLYKEDIPEEYNS